MISDSIRLCVPAEAAYARVVRMTASNLAVLADMDVDDVDDVRMAAEEGFVYACATEPTACDVAFIVSPEEMRIDFALGDPCGPGPTGVGQRPYPRALSPVQGRGR